MWRSISPLCSCLHVPSRQASSLPYLRREPLERRKAALTRLLVRAHHGVQLNEHLEAEGALVFDHACRMGLEGIISKRKGSPYRSGRSQHWLKAKNPNSPAVKRLAEEEWGR